jgi:hypothetical protein
MDACAVQHTFCEPFSFQGAAAEIRMKPIEGVFINVDNNNVVPACEQVVT